MTNLEIKTIVKSVMDEVMPTMAEAIAKALVNNLPKAESTESKPAPSKPVASKPVATPAPAEPVPAEPATSGERKCVVFEYSDAMWGVADTLKEDCKKLNAIQGKVRFCTLRAYKDGSIKGWLYRKKEIDEPTLVAILKGHGYEVTIGESCKERLEELQKEDAKNAEGTEKTGNTEGTENTEVTESAGNTETTEKTEVAENTEGAKVVPMAVADFNVQSFRGDVITEDCKWAYKVVLSQIPTMHEGYYTVIDGVERTCAHVGNQKFVALGSALDATIGGTSLAKGGVLQYHDIVKQIETEGLYKLWLSQNEKKPTKASKHIIEAYRAAGYTEIANYMESKSKQVG